MKGGLRGAVALSRLFLQERVRPGDRVVDATCGNGHDTLLLAGLVGPEGKVWAFDIQEQALAATAAKLRDAGCRDRVELVHAGHENLAEHVDSQIRAVVFNLGYLPGGDRGIVTTPASTIVALDHASQLLLPGGIMVVCVYTGHPGGAVEGTAVGEWAAMLTPEQFNVWSCRQPNRSASAPFIVLIEKTPV